MNPLARHSSVPRLANLLDSPLAQIGLEWPVAERQAFLQKIREQAAKGRAHRVRLDPAATADASYVGGGADPVATLLAEWSSAGGRGVRLLDAGSFRDWLRQFIRDREVRRVLRWEHPLLDRLGIDDVLQGEGVEIGAWDELSKGAESQRWPVAFAADLGITSVDLAVAETGSLMLSSNGRQGRVCSLLPPLFLGIVQPSQIVPDLFDAFAALEKRKSDLPSSVVFVTGPSKTGDIELKLTTGVHGPGHVVLAVVENP